VSCAALAQHARTLTVLFMLLSRQFGPLFQRQQAGPCLLGTHACFVQ
jgi:hypothetical protein